MPAFSVIGSSEEKQIGGLSVSSCLENNEIPFGSVGKVWTAIKLNRKNAENCGRSSPVDFIVLVDNSCSMKQDRKLTCVLEALGYLISQLSSKHRLCLIFFNDLPEPATEGLVWMTEENKAKLVQNLKNISTRGNTDLSAVMLKSFEMLAKREPSERMRISTLLLFTDGLCNLGLKAQELVSQLEKEIPKNITITTFGLGQNHDSGVLKKMAFCSDGGVYYCIKDSASILPRTKEVVSSILSFEAFDIAIDIEAYPGTRIIHLDSTLRVIEREKVKRYSVHIGSMFNKDSVSILLQLSLRKLEQAQDPQNLVKVVVNFMDPCTEEHKAIETKIQISRPPAVSTFQPKPLPLDQEMNRFESALAIEESIGLAKRANFDGAKASLERAIVKIADSPSGNQPFCRELIKDLQNCLAFVGNGENFLFGRQTLNDYSSMYFAERLHFIKSQDEGYTWGHDEQARSRQLNSSSSDGGLAVN